MRKSFGANNFLYPMPVLVIGTYDENGNPDAMTAAWGGFSDTNEICVCLSAEHKTTKNIVSSRCFTVSPGTVDTAVQCDYVGMVSGNDEPDKMKKAGLSAERAKHVNAPVFRELPMALECELVRITGEGLVIARVVDVTADESILGDDGKILCEKLRPICFDGVADTYRSIGESVEKAFSCFTKLG